MVSSVPVSVPEQSNEAISIGDFSRSDELLSERFRFHRRQKTVYPPFLTGLTLLFLAGMFYGVLLIRSGSNSFLQEIAYMGQGYLEDRFSKSLWNVFFSSFGSSLVFLGISFWLGFSAWGQFGALLLLFFRGLGLGSGIGYLYLRYGLSGIGFSALFLLPAGVVAVFALLLSVREAMRLSNLFFLSLVKGGERDFSSVLKKYMGKHGILLAITGVAALLDTVITFLFAGLFPFGMNLI